jgi:hypothetical protein
VAEEGKAKYAAEAWELIRLFSRLGRTVYGLLILLIAWVLLVKAGREMLGSKETVDGFWVPSVTRWWPPTLKWYHPSVSFLTTAGVAVFAVLWLLYSRLFSYVWAFTRHFLKPIILILAYVVPLVLLLINLPLLLVTIPLARLIRWSRRRRFRANWLAKRAEAIKDETPEQREKAWQAHLEALHQKHDKKVIEGVLTEGSWDPSYFMIADVCAGAIGRLLRGMLSHCRVGLAPITPQSYVEEFLAAKLPLQVFAQAITRIREELGELALLDRIQFIELPPSARLQQSSQASRYAWLFDADVLLWGTYKASSERVISLNLFSRFARRKKANEDDQDKYGNEYQRRFFPWEIRIDFPALSFDQDDEEEVYLVLLVAEILALQGANKRWEEGWRQMLSGHQVLDRLSLYSHGTIQEILLRVIPTALGRLGPEPLPERKPLTGRHALVDLAGQWVGSMLNVQFQPPFEDLSARKGTETTLAQLRALAEACTRLDPKSAIAHYRAGALRILTKAKKEAIQSFRQAGKIERDSFQVHEIGARVAADMTDFGLAKNEDIALAVWAAHAACAINTGSEHAIEDIRQIVDEKLPEKLYYRLLEKPEPLAISVIRDMLPARK